MIKEITFYELYREINGAKYFASATRDLALALALAVDRGFEFEAKTITIDASGEMLEELENSILE